jgi:hypothetical protein
MFEAAAMVAGESMVLSVALDPNGATSGTVDLAAPLSPPARAAAR